MACSATQTDNPKLDANAPDEEAPVECETHPFCCDNTSATSSPGDKETPFEQESDPDKEEVPPVPNTRSKTRSARPKDSDESEGEEDHTEEGESLSDRDEALSEGESSYGEDSQFAGPPNLQRLVRLGTGHCRCPCRMKNKDGVKVASICGKKSKDCQLHAKRRLGAESYQYAIGS
jgi:hypothetical protein